MVVTYRRCLVIEGAYISHLSRRIVSFASVACSGHLRHVMEVSMTVSKAVTNFEAVSSRGWVIRSVEGELVQGRADCSRLEPRMPLPYSDALRQRNSSCCIGSSRAHVDIMKEFHYAVLSLVLKCDLEQKASGLSVFEIDMHSTKSAGSQDRRCST